MAQQETDDGLTVSSMIKEIQGLKDKFKDEDEELPSPFQVLI
jgi:coatomer subunit gamma